jgi:hypothetical protein
LTKISSQLFHLQFYFTLHGRTSGIVQTRHCEIRGNGMHQNLIVTGANITLRGLLFSNGFGLNGDGGNVEIRATGHHRIVQCAFVNGTATNNGGNLAVKLAETVVVQDSSFSFGLGLGGAGGLYIAASKSSVVNNSIFEGNVGGSNVGSTGGGLWVKGGRSVEIVQSYFLENSADLGGGFFVSHLASFPALKILHCRFELNSAVKLGGPGAMILPMLASTVDIRHNGGAPNNVVLNSTTGCEHGFEVAVHDFDIDSYVCIELEDDFVIADF